MQKTFLGLAFATAFSATATASEDTSWLALDQEISNLSTVAVDNHGVQVSGFLTTVYTSNSDDDIGGWDFNGVRLNFKASVEDVAVKVSTDLGSGGAELKDAYARWSLADGIDMTMGRFKTPFLYGVSVSQGSQLFLSRTANSEIYSAANFGSDTFGGDDFGSSRDHGLMFSGALGDMGTWSLAASNGGDGSVDELRLTGRVVFDVAGGGAFGAHEGGVDYFGSDETHFSIALAYDDTEDARAFGADISGTRVAVEMAAAMSNFWLHIDYVEWDGDSDNGLLEYAIAPMGVTASYMVQEDLELAVRYEELDDPIDSSVLTVGGNYYMALPHAVKWTLQYSEVDSDLGDGDLIALGLTVNF